ncbi:MAG TPA: alpha/beta hydrolase, partial [Sphingopyxis sp.]|nr:alpha/beta hydrolase [Sphingopyxis sp.]
DQLAAGMKANGQEALAGTSPEIMADELIANANAFDWTRGVSVLGGTNLFLLSSDDGLAAGTDALAEAIRKEGGGAKLRTLHVATDHSWSDARVRLQAELLGWLETLKTSE